jgi:hypothetical protein
VDDQSKARQSARISPGPSKSGSDATLLVAIVLEMDVVVSPLRAVPQAPPPRAIAGIEAVSPSNVRPGRRIRQSG